MIRDRCPYVVDIALKWCTEFGRLANQEIEPSKRFKFKVKTRWIDRVYQENVAIYVTKDEKANYEIVSKIFDSKMIDLNNMVIETKVENGRLFIQYYDTNILENVIEYQSDKTIKLNKKTKLFV